MKFTTIAFQVLFRIPHSNFSTYGSRSRVLMTLINLFLRSKFSSRHRGGISSKLGGYTILAFDYPTLISLYIDIFLFRIYDFHSENEKPFIIDCGAHMGMSVLFFKKIYPKATIWAFEPNPEVFQLLKQNIENNKLTNVNIYNTALSDVSESLPFYIPIKKGSLNGSFIKGYASSTVSNIETVTLSSLLKGEIIDFMKIDTEGAEEKIIRDLDEAGMLLLSKQLVIEYHHQINNSPAQLSRFLSYFEKNNFRYSIKKVNDVDVRRQDLIIEFVRF